MLRDRVHKDKLIQSSCALGWNWGTTDHRVTIIYAFYFLIHMYFDASLLYSYVSLLVLTSYALICFRGTTHHGGGRRLSRRAGRQTQSCGCVLCNSKSRSGRVSATTELFVKDTAQGYASSLSNYTVPGHASSLSNYTAQGHASSLSNYTVQRHASSLSNYITQSHALSLSKYTITGHSLVVSESDQGCYFTHQTPTHPPIHPKYHLST